VPGAEGAVRGRAPRPARACPARCRCGRPNPEARSRCGSPPALTIYSQALSSAAAAPRACADARPSPAGRLAPRPGSDVDRRPVKRRCQPTRGIRKGRWEGSGAGGMGAGSVGRERGRLFLSCLRGGYCQAPNQPSPSKARFAEVFKYSADTRFAFFLKHDEGLPFLPRSKTFRNNSFLGASSPGFSLSTLKSAKKPKTRRMRLLRKPGVGS
jgi:hypothetical protein